jgi:hypothetical protein
MKYRKLWGGLDSRGVILKKRYCEVRFEFGFFSNIFLSNIQLRKR